MGMDIGFRRRGIGIILFAARVWGLRGSLGQGCANLATSRVSRLCEFGDFTGLKVKVCEFGDFTGLKVKVCEFGDFTGLKVKVVRVWRLHGSQGQGM